VTVWQLNLHYLLAIAAGQTRHVSDRPTASRHAGHSNRWLL